MFFIYASIFFDIKDDYTVYILKFIFATQDNGMTL